MHPKRSEMRTDQTSPKGVDNFDAENEQNIPYFIFTLQSTNENEEAKANTDPFVR